jgi:cellulose synthase/poly-beta-1,6-N-acetylglucosamine synthase-like glycosyltransferase
MTGMFGQGLIGAALLILADYHWSKIGVPSAWQVPANFIFFFWLFGMTVMSWLNEDFDGKLGAGFTVCVVVPAYNEDPVTFKTMLRSLDAQTRLPDRVYIVDDVVNWAKLRPILR